MDEPTNPISDAHLLALGNIGVSFQVLESIVRYSLGALVTNDTEVADHLLAGIGFRELADMLSRVVDQRGDGWVTSQKSEFHRLVKRISRAGERRSELLHSEWTPGKLQHIAVRYKAKRSALYEVNDYEETAENLEQFARRLSGLVVQLADQMETVGVPIFAAS